ncbi:MAG: 2'-5' RNA ligase family protein [Spirulinaceae cyanobacterium]
MSESQHRFFIALLPSVEVQDYANQVKQQFVEVYNSRAAQNSPPHITLQPPFLWQKENLPPLEKSLQEFAQNQFPIPITFSGFGAFSPRVIYLNVSKTPELLQIKQELEIHLQNNLGIVHKEPKNRQFTPHLTVVSRGLSKENFSLAWQEYKNKELYLKCTIAQLTLLIYNGKNWEIKKEFSLLNN